MRRVVIGRPVSVYPPVRIIRVSAPADVVSKAIINGAGTFRPDVGCKELPAVGEPLIEQENDSMELPLDIIHYKLAWILFNLGENKLPLARI